MKNCRIGILLLALALLLTMAGCFRNRDKNKDNTTTGDSSPLVPSPDATLPGEDGETSPQMTEDTGDTDPGIVESTTGSTTSAQETTTQKQESTTAKQESTTKKPESTTSKTEVTTKKPETTTSKTEASTTKKPETTTKKPETTTKKPETTTKIPETTTEKPNTTTERPGMTTTERETDELPAPIVTPGPDMTTTMPNGGTTGESMTLPTPGENVTLPTPGESTSNTSNGSTTTPNSGSTTTEPNSGAQTTAPEIGAGEWLHFEKFTDDHAGAAAYLGRSAQELAVTDIIAHFGLPLEAEDITVIDRGDSEDSDGDAWYLILPRYRDTVVRIREAEQLTRKRTKSGELIAEGMHPMLIRCDPEDGEPSVYVELIRGGETVTFALTVDKTSGKPTFHEQVLDITPAQMTR